MFFLPKSGLSTARKSLQKNRQFLPPETSMEFLFPHWIPTCVHDQSSSDPPAAEEVPPTQTHSIKIYTYLLDIVGNIKTIKTSLTTCPVSPSLEPYAWARHLSDRAWQTRAWQMAMGQNLRLRGPHICEWLGMYSINHLIIGVPNFDTPKWSNIPLNCLEHVRSKIGEISVCSGHILLLCKAVLDLYWISFASERNKGIMTNELDTSLYKNEYTEYIYIYIYNHINIY